MNEDVLIEKAVKKGYLTVKDFKDEISWRDTSKGQDEGERARELAQEWVEDGLLEKPESTKSFGRLKPTSKAQRRYNSIAGGVGNGTKNNRRLDTF